MNQRLSTGWLDYSQHAGFTGRPGQGSDPAGQAKVELAADVRPGQRETFTDLQHAQTATTVWCARTARMRIHGSTAARPLEVFNELQQAALLPIPQGYDVPALRAVEVHRDFHVEIAEALYSVPVHDIGVDDLLVERVGYAMWPRTRPPPPRRGRSTQSTRSWPGCSAS